MFIVSTTEEVVSLMKKQKGESVKPSVPVCCLEIEVPNPNCSRFFCFTFEIAV